MDLSIGVGYDSNFDVVEKAMMSLMDDKRIYQEPAPVFHVVSYGDSAINVRVRLYADYDDLFQLGWDLNRRLKPALTQPRLKSLSSAGGASRQSG